MMLYDPNKNPMVRPTPPPINAPILTCEEYFSSDHVEGTILDLSLVLDCYEFFCWKGKEN